MRAAALAAAAGHVAQSAVAAGVAWLIAHRLVGHVRPFFAPVAALVVLNAAAVDRTRRAVELAFGVAVGIGVGDLLVSAIGTGAWQIGLVVALALSSAVLLGGGPLFVSQAATSGVLVAAIPGTHSSSRFVDALVGGAVGLGAVVALPQHPLRAARRESSPLFAELAGVLEDVATALEAGDVAAMREALARARAAEPLAVRWLQAVQAGLETARLSPLYWRYRGRLDEEAGAARQLELALRNARVLARAAVREIETAPPPPPELPASLRRLADAVREVEPALERRDRSEPIASALAATTLASRALEQRPDLAAAHVVGQIRSLATDLLRALGVERAAAVEHVRRAAAVSV